MSDRMAWEYIGSDGIKRCPNCGATELEGMETCSECVRGPFEDREWRAQGRSTDHVMRRAEFEVMVGRACRPRSGDADHVEACEDRRARLLHHDAALRDRLDRLSVERAHCYRKLRQISTEDLPIAGDGGPQEVLIAMHSALLDLIEYLEDEDG